MEEREKKALNKSNQVKQKRKRKVSLITVFLWLFLIAIMSVIMLSSTKKKSALEIVDNNWNIGLVMYDRSSDTPNEAITDFTWNATESSEKKELVMQINYNCTTGKAYQPGEIVIEVDGFGRNGSEKNKNYMPSATIAADNIGDTTKKYDFSYSYDELSNKYSFVNNDEIALNEHFEGTIQIVYSLEPKFKIQTDLHFKAKLKENIINADEIIAMESNICNFHYTSNKMEYRLSLNARIDKNGDYTNVKDIFEDYYWVMYSVNINDKGGIISTFGKEDKEYLNIKNILPEGCVLYNISFSGVSKEDNTYYLSYIGNDNISYKSYYVGYPKSKYNEGDIIENSVELLGRYEDEEEIKKIYEDNCRVTLEDFDFEYKGNLYNILKANVSSRINISDIKKYSVFTSWWLESKAIYSGSKMDIEIGDDLLYITRESGEISELQEDEYNFTYIDIPVFEIARDENSDKEKLIGYNYELQVRYKDTKEYVIYKEGLTSDTKETITFDRNDIVGVKLIIKDVDKSVHFATYTETKIYPKNCKVGNLYNFSFLQVYKKYDNGDRVLDNSVNLDNYSSEMTKLKIAEYDMSTYGRYMQRSFGEISIIDGIFRMGLSKKRTIFNNNVKESKYDVSYDLTTNLNLNRYDVNKDVIINVYDILPAGMNLVSSKEEIINSITTKDLYEHLKLKDGTVFNSNYEFDKYIKSKTNVDIDYNYKNSGRIKIKISYNLNDINWSYYLEHSFSILKDYIIRTSIKTEIPYDSIVEYGANYNNYAYAMWNNQEYDYYEFKDKDNGRLDKLASDLDNDGDTEEIVVYNWNNLDIIHAVSSRQAVIKQVRTDLTEGKFVEGTAVVNAGSEYTYKLKTTTGTNNLKDLIIYDTLETTYDENGNEITEGWKGKFLNVDTSYAMSKGYAPKVYYSEEKNPGKLPEVPEKWKELTDEVNNKSIVKSICVDLRYKADGSEMELGGNDLVYVLINMRAPNDSTLNMSASNMFNTSWKVKDSSGGEIDGLEGIYSNEVNVKIFKEVDRKEDICGIKLWEDDNDSSKKRPESITVKLMQDGVEYKTKEVTNNDNWRYVFEDVPVYKNDKLERYEYSIVEEKVPYYSTTYDGYNIINTLSGKDITGEKIWNYHWLDRNRPESITVKLMQDGIEYMRKEVTSSDNWKYTFEDVPIYKNENKDEYEYTIEEVKLPRYTSTYEGYNIENELKTIELKVTKVWDDNDNVNGIRPKFVLIKVHDGENFVNEIYVRAENDWKCTFELPEYRVDGSEIEYTIVEVVEEYREEYWGGGVWDYENNFENEGDYELYQKYYVTQVVGSTITNKYVDPDERIKIVGTKLWEDEENKAEKRPDSVVLQLKSGDKVISEEVATRDSNWKVEFEVPRYDENKNEIKYYIDEKETLKFYEKELTDDYTVTNKFIIPDEKVKVEVIKLWEDLENKYEKRPSSVTLQVLNGDNVVAEQMVDEGTNWRYEFELLKYDELGNEIEYTVNEKEDVKYYEKRISGYTVINKCVYEQLEENIENDEKPNLPSTSDINIVIYVIIFVIAIIGVVVGIIFLRKNKK